MDTTSYGKRINNYMMGGFISAAISLGYELGLFKVLTELEEPVSFQKLSELTDLKQRYVREWLGCMTAARLVSVNDRGNYFIPGECKSSLGIITLSPVLGGVFDRTKLVASCFRKDGPNGFSYDSSHEIFDWLDQEGTSWTVGMIRERFLSTVLHHRGLYVRSTAKVIYGREKLRKKEKPVYASILLKWNELGNRLISNSGSDTIRSVLDVGCGSGRMSLQLAKALPSTTVIGIDPCEYALSKAQQLIQEEEITNLNFEKQNAECLPSNWSNKFDFVVMWDVMHDLPDPKRVLEELRRVLKEDGVLAIQDPPVHSNHAGNAGNEQAAFALSLSLTMCLPNSLNKEPSAGLGVGWGMEAKLSFIENLGWKTINRNPIDGNAMTFIKDSKK